MIEQQLGPPPGPHASAGLIIQYSTMRKMRLRTAAVDNICNIMESLAVLTVKLLVCQHLQSGAVASGTVCWRLVFLPLWCVSLGAAAGKRMYPMYPAWGSWQWMVSSIACISMRAISMRAQAAFCIQWHACETPAHHEAAFTLLRSKIPYQHCRTAYLTTACKMAGKGQPCQPAQTTADSGMRGMQPSVLFRRILWPLTTAASWFKAPSERMLGSIADLMSLTAVFVALKLDGVVGYSWKVR